MNDNIGLGTFLLAVWWIDAIGVWQKDWSLSGESQAGLE